jgi:hypothetical protein
MSMPEAVRSLMESEALIRCARIGRAATTSTAHRAYHTSLAFVERCTLNDPVVEAAETIHHEQTLQSRLARRTPPRPRACDLLAYAHARARDSTQHL